MTPMHDMNKEENDRKRIAKYDVLINSLGKGILDKEIEERDLFEPTPFTPNGTLEQKKELVEEAIIKNYEWVQSVTKILEKKKIFDTIQEEISRNDTTTSKSDIQQATDLLQEFHQANQNLKEIAHKMKCLDTLEDIFKPEKDIQQDTELEQDEAKFKAFYMEEFTKAFGDELDAFRQEENGLVTQKDVNQLVACIHTSGDLLYSKEQKKLMMMM